MNAETLKNIKNIISVMPEKPGVYQYFDKEGTIIYVGKAKNLKRRVSSYFNKNNQSVKTNMLVRHIETLKYFIVESEEDALHLENSMIKEYQPKYNILLKDDKTYPWIVIKKEPFPRIFLTRTIIKDGSKYYGPYSNVGMAKVVLSLIKRLYPIRSCTHLLSNDRIKNGKYSKCLEFHIKNCNAPCVGLESNEKYDEYIRQARQILNGETAQLSQILMEEMQKLSSELKFEEAQKIKEKYLMLENYRSKSVIVNSSVNNVDVFGYDDYEGNVYINYMNIREGAIIQSMTISYKKRLDEEKEYILALGITELRERFGSNAREIIVPFEIGVESANYTITIPQRGDKRHLLEISTKNAIQYRIDLTKQSEKLNPEQRTTRILTQLAKDFRLKELPRHMECFDNSNIQGTNAVSACVVFKNAKPSKKEYRHFNVKTVVGANDYATMHEVIFRRYRRMIDEGATLPQLIVVDGGKGQLSVAIEALKELDLYGKIAIVGIAERLEEIYFPNDPIPLYIDKNSESLRVIQHMRDEAHRFGITHHRKKRSKAQISSELDTIKGIGEKSKQLLLKEFKSIKRIKDADFESIAKIIGNSKATILTNALNNKEVN
ncbi:MAG: excinuclease ABC subunit UvrC [Bacteroidales bacterium]|nr:excinuclease ABC subunit UvrC [Bacteroidales bacterium]